MSASAVSTFASDARLLPVDGERAHLQQVELPVAADGELHIDRVAREKGFELADEGDDRCQRGGQASRPRFEAEKGLEIVAGTGRHTIGSAGRSS